MSIKYGLLALLSRRPLHGYELKHEFEVELGSNWTINYGQIYTTLGRLERDGLIVQTDIVTVSDAPDRKLFEITQDGLKELDKWFLTPLIRLDGLKNEFYAKVILSFTSNVSTDDILHIQRKAELQKLHELTHLKENADPALDLPWILQLDLAILHTEATLNWLDMCEARLKKLKDFFDGGPSVKSKTKKSETKQIDSLRNSLTKDEDMAGSSDTSNKVNVEKR